MPDDHGIARCVDARRLTAPGSPRGRCTIGPGSIVTTGSRKLNMPRSRAWFSLSHPAEPDCDLGRQRSVGAAVICALFIGSAILALAASKSLDVTSAIAEEPVAPIPEPPPAAALKIAIGERLFADPRLSRSRTKAAREAVPRVTTSARMAPARASRISLWMARSFPSIPAPSSTPRSASDSIGREDSAPSRSQALASLENPRIMGAKIAEVVERLGADPDMVRQFRSAYGRGPDSANVLDAIAVFERSLLTPGSRFDRWLAGDESALVAGRAERIQPVQVPGLRLLPPRREHRRQSFPAPRNISAAGLTAARDSPRAEPAKCREHSALFP